MGVEYLNRAPQLALRFEKLVFRLFQAQGCKVDVPIINPSQRAADFLVTSPKGVRAAVEIKLYSSQKTGGKILLNAARQAEAGRQSSKADRSILVVNSRVDQLTRAELYEIPNLIIYDYDIISRMFLEYPSLITEFEEILDEAFAFRAEARPTPISDNLIEAVDFRNLTNPTVEHSDVQPESLGRILSRQIKDIPVGRQGAMQFEKKCRECFEYIFADDLGSWQDQVNTDTGIHRFDLIAKIRSNTDFWISLVRDFRTRYVVFEFKNYTDPISQGQIHTTEKYLFPMAMRGTALIVARSGADRNAYAVARGALRESGKLILILSLEDLCKLLEMKDNGKDPGDILAQIMDEMLIRLER